MKNFKIFLEKNSVVLSVHQTVTEFSGGGIVCPLAEDPQTDTL